MNRFTVEETNLLSIYHEGSKAQLIENMTAALPYMDAGLRELAKRTLSKVGALTEAERTAAAEGTLGELRRDPFAMLPFCGYNMGDYFSHWLKVGRNLRFDRAPRIFQVNWFRRGEDGRFLWPGFGDNSRVIDWVIRRISGEVDAVDSPIGRLPRIEDLNLDGLEISQADLDELFSIDTAAWSAEADSTEEFFSIFGDHLPAALRSELEALR